MMPNVDISVCNSKYNWLQPNLPASNQKSESDKSQFGSLIPRIVITPISLMCINIVGVVDL